LHDKRRRVLIIITCDKYSSTVIATRNSSRFDLKRRSLGLFFEEVTPSTTRTRKQVQGTKTVHPSIVAAVVLIGADARQ